MIVTDTMLKGVRLFEPQSFDDDRGFFLELYNEKRYRAQGLEESFVQDNLSFSRKGVLRGLHFQHPNGQGKLVSVPFGEVFDVAVDIRVGSPTFGRWVSAVLSAENKRQLFIPPGFAHGFCVTSDAASVLYKTSEFYDAKSEGTLVWDDPRLEIDWPTTSPILSEKDAQGIRLADFPVARLPRYNG